MDTGAQVETQPTTRRNLKIEKMEVKGQALEKEEQELCRVLGTLHDYTNAT